MRIWRSVCVVLVILSVIAFVVLAILDVHDEPLWIGIAIIAAGAMLFGLGGKRPKPDDTEFEPLPPPLPPYNRHKL